MYQWAWNQVPKKVRWTLTADFGVFMGFDDIQIFHNFSLVFEISSSGQ